MIPTFVFGSNLAGRHGKGAALYALKHYGAKYGIGEGIQGNSYAIPTKDENLKVRSLVEIEDSIAKFLDFADLAEDRLFMVTPIGTGLAGYSLFQIKDIFDDYTLSENILFTGDWIKKSWD